MEENKIESGNKIIAVPEQWLRSLLKDAIAVEEENKNYHYDNDRNSRFHIKAIALMGYAKSAKSILNNNDSFVKPLK